MGSCLSSPTTDDGGSTRGRGSRGRSDVPRNQPLRSGLPKWKHETPLTEGQLRSKRDEFWDTAPLFEGRKEIWDALKAAAYALEMGDHDLAQAIVDGASITLPGGTLLECYDELGARYQLPVYTFSRPANMVGAGEGDEDGTAQHDEAGNEDVPAGKEVTLKLRLSTTGQDKKLIVRTTDTVLSIKQMLEAAWSGEGQGVPAGRQRWFFGGQLIKDKSKVKDLKVPHGHVVQVIVPQVTEGAEAGETEPSPS